MGELAKRVIQSLQLDQTPGHSGTAQETDKKDIIDSLIGKTLEEINEGHESGTLEWLRKNRPQVWQRSLALEEDINEAALRKDIEALRRVLAEYKDLILSAVKEFRPTEERTRVCENRTADV